MAIIKGAAADTYIHVCADIGHVLTSPSLSCVILIGAFTNRNSTVELEPLIWSAFFHQILYPDHKNLLSLKPYGFEFYNYEFGKSKGHKQKPAGDVE